MSITAISNLQYRLLKSLTSSSQHPRGVRELANQFGITTRAVRRNLTQLRKYYPIVATYGSGYYLCKNKKDINNYILKINQHINKEKSLIQKMKKFLK